MRAPRSQSLVTTMFASTAFFVVGFFGGFLVAVVYVAGGFPAAGVMTAMLCLAMYLAASSR